MEEISKKELLEQTGISYGQLYRWKRERLIPEEWFVKRSAITGQETFFPRTQILDRIRSIVDLKEEHSLEEIREELATEKRMVLLREIGSNETLCLLRSADKKYYVAVSEGADIALLDEGTVILRAETTDDLQALAAGKKKGQKKSATKTKTEEKPQ